LYFRVESEAVIAIIENEKGRPGVAKSVTGPANSYIPVLPPGSKRKNTDLRPGDQ
jgi:hypothetical protein